MQLQYTCMQREGDLRFEIVRTRENAGDLFSLLYSIHSDMVMLSSILYPGTIKVKLLHRRWLHHNAILFHSDTDAAQSIDVGRHDVAATAAAAADHSFACLRRTHTRPYDMPPSTAQPSLTISCWGSN